jgi:hypothetical protein
MKINRFDPVRRRRSPLSKLLIIIAILLGALLVASWMMGGEQPMKPVEVVIPADQLGR